MVAAKTFQEWYAFFGGEEMAVSRDDAVVVWEAAIATVQKPGAVSCRWKYDLDTSSYDTSCGEKWCFPDGTPAENGLKYCPVCGKRAVVTGGKHDD